MLILGTGAASLAACTAFNWLYRKLRYWCTSIHVLERLPYRNNTCIHWISSTLVNTAVVPIKKSCPRLHPVISIGRLSIHHGCWMHRQTANVYTCAVSHTVTARRQKFQSLDWGSGIICWLNSDSETHAWASFGYYSRHSCSAETRHILTFA